MEFFHSNLKKWIKSKKYISKIRIIVDKEFYIQVLY
jgi:hypothetical protein